MNLETKGSIQGPDKLMAWLKRRKGKTLTQAQAQAGEALGVTGRAVRSWADGNRRPSVGVARRLQELTRGRVKVVDFYPELGS